MNKFGFLLCIFFSACGTPKNITAPGNNKASLVINGKVFGSIFQQQAAEYNFLLNKLLL